MSEVSDEAVHQFMELAQVDESQARFLLEAAGGDTDGALQLLFGEPPPQSHSPAQPFRLPCLSVRTFCCATGKQGLIEPGHSRSRDVGLSRTCSADQAPQMAQQSRRPQPAPQPAPPIPRPEAPSRPAPLPPRPPAPASRAARNPAPAGRPRLIPGILGAVLRVPAFLIRTSLHVVSATITLGLGIAAYVGDRVLPAPIMRILRGMVLALTPGEELDALGQANKFINDFQVRVG